jgi:hypothetical protein
MNKETIAVYDLIPFQDDITPKNIEITNLVFETIKNPLLNNQGDSVHLDVSHDCIYQLVYHVVTETLKRQ